LVDLIIHWRFSHLYLQIQKYYIINKLNKMSFQGGFKGNGNMGHGYGYNGYNQQNQGWQQPYSGYHPNNQGFDAFNNQGFQNQGYQNQGFQPGYNQGYQQQPQQHGGIGGFFKRSSSNDPNKRA
jgi:hypothetical protein